MFGFALDWRKRLSVISVYGSSLSHSEDGKYSAVPANTLRKCALNFLTDTSAAFLRWHPGGTNSMSMWYLSRIIAFVASDTSLSRTCLLGTIPARFNCVIIARYALVSSGSLQLFIGSNRIALLSMSTITMTYLFPLCKRVGNFPV